MEIPRFEKQLFVLEDWKVKIDLPKPIEDVKSIKLNWLYYETSSNGGRFFTMAMNFTGFRNNGLFIRNNGATNDFFYSTSLDSRANVSLYTDNFVGEHDVYINPPLPKLWSFELEMRINGQPAFDITPANPVIVEFRFYQT